LLKMSTKLCRGTDEPRYFGSVETFANDVIPTMRFRRDG